MQCHCARCHHTFSSPSAFDMHRSGRKKTPSRPARAAGECYDPESSGLTVTEKGIWAKPGTRPEGTWKETA